MRTRERELKVFMMDILATVPYYTAYLSRALLSDQVDVTVGSISYYLDPTCFSSRGLRLDPGLFNVVGRFRVPWFLRRPLKLVEALVNLLALTVRFSISPPAILHIQFLPLVRWPVPLDGWFVMFCRWRGSKAVLTIHDLLPHDTADSHKQIFLRLYHRMDSLICHSEHIGNRLVDEFGMAPYKIAVIPHGPFFYDLPSTGDRQFREELAISPSEQIVLWQGIIFPYKGLDLLLSAWKQVEASVPEARLVVLGTGSPELLQQVRTLVQAEGLQRVTLHLHFTSAEMLVEAYRAATVVVYPYRAITTSGALASGLALGKAIVASDLPVFRELLTNGEDALLVDSSNPGELADAIGAVLTRSELHGRLEAAVRAKNFGAQAWSEIAHATKAVYEAALASRP